MRPVGDAMAIAMRDVEKLDRKILVADLQIFATSEVANIDIFRCFSGAVFPHKCARKYLRPIFARKFVKKVANKYGIFATFATTFASTKTLKFATSKFIECLQIIIIFC